MKKILAILFLFYGLNLFSQTSLRVLKTKTDTVKINAIVVPSTIEVAFSHVDSNLSWKWNDSLKAIVFSQMPVDTVIVKYRAASLSVFLKDTAKNKPLIVPVNPAEKTEYATNTDNIKETDIVQKGYLERSVTLGNNTNPVLNSKMNLELNGRLNDDLMISAKLNDNHIPVQPDGNTARINDIDEISIKVYNDDFSLQAGDIRISDTSQFLRYNRSIKGLFYKQNIDSVQYYEGGFAVGKGKYARQTVNAVEGVQGPYKLNGKNGETFIIILPESEKIWIDGKLLKRGENAGYTIDYNTAEITFTANVPVTKDSRIIAEFQYRQRDYASFLIAGGAGFNLGNRQYYVNVYQRKDAVNQTLDYTLNDTAKQILFNVGDSLENAVMLAVDSVGFDEKKILYEKKDSTVNGTTYTIYEYSTNPAYAVYDVHFVYVGNGMGDYVIDESIVNGRVYKWQAPVNGQKQGDYDIYTHLVAPQKHTVAEFGGEILKTATDTLSFSLATSIFDENLISSYGDNDNTGVALWLKNSLLLVQNDKLKRLLNFSYEYAGKNFAEIDRYRYVEFERDWNLDTLPQFTSHFFDFGVSQLSENLKIETGIDALLYFEKYSGFKFFFNTSRVGEKWNFFIKNSSLFSFDDKKNSVFLKNYFSPVYHNDFIRTGFEFSQEINKRRYVADLQLDTISQSFDKAIFFVSSKDTSNLFYRLEYNRRFDFLPYADFLKYASFSDNFQIKASKNKGSLHFDFVTNYRQLRVIDTNLLFLRSKKSINGVFSVHYSFLNDAFSQNITMKFSNAMEPQMQFVYIEVEPSLGNYKWQDFNGDGIAQTDEFVAAFFSDEANFRRVAVQTNRYIATFYKNLSVGQVFSPSRLFAEQTFVKKLFSHFQNTASLQFDYKSQSSNIMLLSMDSALMYLFYFTDFINMTIKDFSFDYYINHSKQKQFLIIGNDFSNLQTNKFVLSWKSDTWILSSEYNIELKKSMSDYSVLKNYSLKEKNYSATAGYTKEQFFITFKYEYSEIKNTDGDEILFSNRVTLINNVSATENTKFNVEFDVIKNNFSGNENTAAAYVMLEGFRNGLNFRWLAGITKKLTNFMNFRFEYDGRFANGGKVVHNGNVGIIAYF